MKKEIFSFFSAKDFIFFRFWTEWNTLVVYEKKRHNLFVPSSCVFVRVCECYLSPWIVVDWASHIWQQRKSNSIADAGCSRGAWARISRGINGTRKTSSRWWAKKKISSELNDFSGHDRERLKWGGRAIKKDDVGIKCSSAKAALVWWPRQ